MRSAMGKILNLLKAILTTGRDHQAFIGARWVVLLLRITPRFLREGMALRILSLSPHYFYRTVRPEDKKLTHGEWLEAERARNHSSRETICDQILLPSLKPDDRVLDIGCGPGFLARAVSRHVNLVYACDISLGVLACARIINHAGNIRYIYSGASGFEQIDDASLDLAYSFAVFQHVREAVIKYLFQVASRKLRAGGACLFQVQLDEEKWKKESNWEDDKSVTGQLRLKYALNFFPRSEGFFRELAAETGFSVVAIRLLSEVLAHPFDDIYYQHLIVLAKL